MAVVEEGTKIVKIKGTVLLFLGALINAVLAWGTLVLAYISYKEYMRGPNNIYLFSSELRTAIKSIFPLEVLIFVALYLLYSAFIRKEGKYRTAKKYFVIIFSYCLISNLILITKGMEESIVLNISVFYLAVIFILYGGVKMAGSVVWSNTPTVIAESISGCAGKVKMYVVGRSSEPFIVGFILLLSMCAILLMFKQEKVAEELANVAYVLLVIGVAKEVYRMARCSEKDEQG